MRTKDPRNELSGFVRPEWVRDKEVSGRVICAAHGRSVCGNLLKRGGERVGIACEEGTGGVGKKFPPAGDRHLYELCGDGCQDNGDDAGDEKERILVVPVPSPSEETHAQENIRDDGNESGQDDRDGHDEDVAVADVREFVRYHSLELASLKAREKPRRHGDDRMLRVPSGRKRVRCGIIYHVEPRLWKSGGNREIFKNAVKFEILHRVGFLGAGRAKGNLVREPVGGNVHYDRKCYRRVEDEGVAVHL